MKSSYDRKFLKQLKNNILKYTEEYHKSKKYYHVSTINELCYIYNFMSKKRKQIKCFPDIYQNLKEQQNLDSFKNVNTKDLKESCLPLEEFYHSDYYYEEILSVLKNKEIVSLINEFLKYSQVDDLNILNNFIKEKRITKVKDRTDELKDYNGFYIFNDFEPNKGYIYLINPDNTYETAATVAHELGHDMTCKKPQEIASKFYFSSLNAEVMSQYYELKFYNFLINENIAKKEGQALKCELIDSIYDSIEDAKRDLDYDGVSYGYGGLISIAISDLSKEEVRSFNQNLIYNQDVKLLNKVISNKKQIQKNLTKEINMIIK